MRWMPQGIIQARMPRFLYMYRSFFKRFFDFCISLAVLVVVSPLLVLVTVWLHFANKGTGVFFLQDSELSSSKR